MAQENIAFVPITLDPLTLIERLPEFSGEKQDLYTFISLVDRINPLFLQYDNPSQLLFIDLIKSKFKGKAKEALEINFHAQSWSEIKTVLINYFGEHQSVEILYDKLRSTVFRTNTLDFYNEIKDRLRSLNNKTVSDLGVNLNSEQIACNNMRTALNIFRQKIPEPMRTILACRNPQTLEEAMNIIFASGYGNYRIGNEPSNFENRNRNRSNTDNKGKRANQSFGSYRNEIPYDNSSHNRNNATRSNDNFGFRPRNTYFDYNGRNGIVNNNNNNRNNNNGRIYGNNLSTPGNNGQLYRQNFSKPFQDRNSYFRQQIPEPMDINMVHNSNSLVHTPQLCPNFSNPIYKDPYCERPLVKTQNE